MVPSRIHFRCATMGTPLDNYVHHSQSVIDPYMQATTVNWVPVHKKLKFRFSSYILSNNYALGIELNTFFFFFWLSHGIWSSRAKDQIPDAVATYTAAAAMLVSLTRSAMQGCGWNLHPGTAEIPWIPLCHNGDTWAQHFNLLGNELVILTYYFICLWNNLCGRH